MAVSLHDHPDPEVTTNDVPTADIVRRAQGGDVDAFEALYRTHAPAVHALARRMLGDEGAAREMVQDIFVRAWERLGTFRGDSALATWLHTLGVNLMLTRLRSVKRERAHFVDDDENEPSGRAGMVPSPGQQLDARMDLDHALAQLPVGARTVFVLHDVEGYSHEEIAQLTGIAAGTARAQLWRARRQLMRLLSA